MSKSGKWNEFLKGFIPGHILAVTMSLIILAVAVGVIIPLNAELNKLTLLQVVYIIVFMLLVIILSTILASFLAKVEINERIHKSIDDHTCDLNKAITSELHSQIKSLEKMLTTSEQIINLSKQEWMLHDEDVSIIEARADAQVDVIAPDLYYEHQEIYRMVIVENIIDEHGPTYRYIIPNVGNEIMKRDVITELVDAVRLKLQENNDPRDPEALVNQRFIVKLLPKEIFPYSVLYGLAYYRWKDGTERLLQYLPRRFGTLNVNIPYNDEKVPYNITYLTREHFDDLFNKQF